ncbi:MAG TPA: glutamate-5-semialdehyde dehydrogenase, partial [Planctomycetes bacterium]|nr:glutamate-5-semialdehyde dehydrogenase [Planctomycetota bacterium]
AEVDLLIPRGGKELVRQIKSSTRIAVLGHADGICHVYVHKDADLGKALRVVVDAKTNYPAVCNAAETILFDREGSARLLPPVVRALIDKGVEVRGCPETRKLVPEAAAAAEDAWSTEYLDLIASVRVVADMAAAVAHINRYGSHHTDAIVTEDEAAGVHFCRYIDSAGVFVNASTRFADGFRYGLGAEIGISTNKIHARGPVGLEGIVTYKYELRGAGHAVGDYGPGKRSYTHRTR